MNNEADDVVGLVKAVVEPLVEFYDDLEIIADTSTEGSVLVEIHVNQEDAGKIIGRRGRVIKAIRTLSRAVGSRTGVQVEVELID